MAKIIDVDMERAHGYDITLKQLSCVGFGEWWCAYAIVEKINIDEENFTYVKKTRGGFVVGCDSGHAYQHKYTQAQKRESVKRELISLLDENARHEE